jgi:transcriptional regulator with XRE-family HTH domain
MQSNQAPIENRFGEEVLASRNLQRISQKDLAEGLRSRGLNLDASAISRIEKGTRAIRLSEAALIAEALGFSLADVEHPREPLEEMTRVRKTLDASLSAAFQEALHVADAIQEMIWLIERDPQLLESLGDGIVEPANLSEYVKSLELNWLGPTNVASAVGVDLESVELRDTARSLNSTVTTMAVGEVADGEHQATT